MKNYLSILIVLLMFGCGRQQKSAEKALQEITQIAKLDSVLSYNDYKKITLLYEKYRDGIITYIENDSTMLVSFISDIVGNSYNEMYYYYGDTTALRKSRDLYLWLNQYYSDNSQYSRFVASRLFEAYCYMKDWDNANLWLEQNLAQTSIPSIDHASLLYAKAWMYSEMKSIEIEDAISTMQIAKCEYEDLLTRVQSSLQNKNITENQLFDLHQGIQYCEDGIKECENRLFEWGVFLCCDGSIKKRNRNDNYVYTYLQNLDSLLTVERAQRAPYENREEWENKDKDGVLDSARLVWTHFVELCKDEQYDEAFSYYEKSAGYFLIYLTYSEFWYRFEANVYLPYYRDKMNLDVFEQKVIDVFQRQQDWADIIIETGKCQNNEYYPSHYEELQSYLFFAYVDAGLWNEAQRQQDYMKTYTIERFRKNHHSYATIVFNQACLYHKTGKLSKAIKTMKESCALYQAYINQHPDAPNLSDIKELRTNAENKLDEWQTLN